MERGDGRGARRCRGLLLLALAVAALAAPSSAGAAESRYSLAGKCFTLTAAATGQAAPGAAQSRMQATRLGSYLLYGPMRDFLAAGAGDSVGRAAAPSPGADWTVEDAGGGAFTLSPASAPNRLLVMSGGNLALANRATAGSERFFAFTPSQGCATYPEAELNVSGTPARGATPFGEVSGLLDGHMHWMTFEYIGGNFHCGRPWHPYGIPSALPDCASIEGPAGVAAPFQNFLNFGQPVAPHSTAGWPTLDSFGRTNLTYEGTYYRWLERVWAAGLRLIVMPINENRVLCELQANRRTNCDEMDTVRRGLDDIEALQDYVDAQAGGPGKGFLRIVRNPFEARKVINDGKMAVVLEVEVSEPFGCRGWQTSSCDAAQVDRSLKELYDRGVRSSLLLNKFDNPLTGVRFDSGPVSPIINAGNVASAGSFWDAKSCQGPHDNTIEGGAPSDPFVASQVAALGVPPGSVPSYPPAPHCNTRGLTALGAHTVRRMMQLGMIVNPDHMSQLAVDSTISLAEQQHYSGVISPHGWMDPRNWPRIYNIGGMAFPDSNSAHDFVADWHRYRPSSSPYYLGWGYGADLGGLAEQPPPEPPSSPAHVTYPFKSLDGSVTIDRQRTGQRVFDYSSEGVAHYGLYADWIEEVRKLGGDAIAKDMLRGPEAYLQMWERSVGVPSSGTCRKARQRFTRRGLGNLRLGLDAQALLVRAGQPLRRTRAWSYCVGGRRNVGAADTAVLTPKGRVALVASDAAGHRAKGIGAGARVAFLKGKARNVGRGLWVGRLRKTTVAYLVHRGKVRLVAVASRPARKRARLRQYLRLVPRKPVKARPKKTPKRLGETPVTPRNAVPLKMQQASANVAFVCGASFQSALGQDPAAGGFSAPTG